MEQKDARALVAVLVAAFRPRDFGRSSEALWIEAITEFDARDAAVAFRQIVWGLPRMPAIAEARAEIFEVARQRWADEHSLPEGPAPTPDELAAMHAETRQILADYHARKAGSD